MTAEHTLMKHILIGVPIPACFRIHYYAFIAQSVFPYPRG